jgi:glycosyltransferase involved in cell wall biosynthesis
MKVVVHIVPTFDLGGVQTGIINSILELRKKNDYKVLIIGKVDAVWLKEIPDEIKSNFILSGSNNYFIGLFKSFIILWKLNPRVIISSLWKSTPISVFYKLLRPGVSLLSFHHTARFVHLLNFIFLKILVFFSDALLNDSNATATYVRKNYSLKKEVKIIPYYFPNKNDLQQKTDFTFGKLRIIYVGRFKPEKGISRTIQFCKKLQELVVDFILDMYGEGYDSKYQREIDDAGVSSKVQLKNLLPPGKVSAKMREYDFLIQLSDNEGMAAAVVEAMENGLVPIVTPVGEIANYSKDGFNAIWLNPNFDENIDQLVLKFKMIIDNSNLYNQMSAAAKTSFVDYQTYTEAMISAIERLDD